MPEITISLLATADDLGYAEVRDDGIVSGSDAARKPQPAQLCQHH